MGAEAFTDRFTEYLQPTPFTPVDGRVTDAARRLRSQAPPADAPEVVGSWVRESLRYAPGATLAPMQYLEIPFATIIGLVVFGDLPNALASMGICITLAAGLYIVIRERAMMRRPQPAPAAPAPLQTLAE